MVQKAIKLHTHFNNNFRDDANLHLLGRVRRGGWGIQSIEQPKQATKRRGHWLLVSGMPSYHWIPWFLSAKPVVFRCGILLRSLLAPTAPSHLPIWKPTENREDDVRCHRLFLLPPLLICVRNYTNDRSMAEGCRRCFPFDGWRFPMGCWGLCALSCPHNPQLMGNLNKHSCFFFSPPCRRRMHASTWPRLVLDVMHTLSPHVYIHTRD